MTLKINIILGSICFLASVTGCKKASIVSFESFLISGHIKDCSTGTAIANQLVLLKGNTPATGGFFGTPSQSFDIGQAYTDANGNYSIKPKKLANISYYQILLGSDEQDITYVYGISADSVAKTGLANYDISFGMNRYGYLKVTLNNVLHPDANDQFWINFQGGTSACGPENDFNYYATYPPLVFANNNILYGRASNVIVYYRVTGDVTNSIFYQKSNNGNLDSIHKVNIYCTEADTTFYTVNY